MQPKGIEEDRSDLDQAQSCALGEYPVLPIVIGDSRIPTSRAFCTPLVSPSLSASMSPHR